MKGFIGSREQSQGRLRMPLGSGKGIEGVRRGWAVALGGMAGEEKPRRSTKPGLTCSQGGG